MAATVYKKKRFAAPGGQFTDIVAPINCNSWSVKSSSGAALTTRSDPSDATTEDSLAGGSQETLTAGRPQGEIAYRYKVGDVVCSVMPAGADTIVGTFVL